jgi:hypothetical protein
VTKPNHITYSAGGDILPMRDPPISEMLNSQFIF